MKTITMEYLHQIVNITIVNLAILNITAEQQYNLNEHNQDLER